MESAFYFLTFANDYYYRLGAMRNDKDINENHQFRMTNQRKAILDEIRKARKHFTADQVYEAVRKHLPRLSLSTVYRNLEMMADAGVLSRLELPGAQRRYDWDVSVHHHAQCSKCGRIADVPAGEFLNSEMLGRDIKGFEVSGYRLELTGLCGKCRLN